MKRTLGRRPFLAASLAAGLAFLGSLWLHRDSALYDTDSYFHLAIARLYAEEGIVDELPQLRMSLLGPPGFGDKELGFHLVLAPLGAGLEPLEAGRLGLALFAALLAAAVSREAIRSVGGWGVLLPFWIVFASTETAWRLVRLRPELLSLLLLLLAARAIVTARPRLLGLLAFLYTLSYTAFHAFLGTAALAVVALAVVGRGGRSVGLLLYPLLGAGLGLVVHPHFPANLEVWLAQNVGFFLFKDTLAVGTEIHPQTTDVVLMVHLGWLAGLGALGLAAREETLEPAREPEAEESRRSVVVFGVFAAVFGLLYLLMSRFSLYFYPFATLWWLARIRARGRRIGSRVDLPGGRGSVPLLVLAVPVLLLSLPEAGRQLAELRHRTSVGPGGERIADREAFSAALPAGARVAADWGPTATYLLWAPQGRYLNALDPLFMAAVRPEAHRALEEILAGRVADVPAAAKAALESDYLAWPWNRHEELRRRLDGDPRIEVLHRGLHHLVRWQPGSGFVLDWRMTPALSGRSSGGPPVAPDADVSAWPSLPRHPDPGVRALEAYVDAERLAPDARCLGFVRDPDLEAGETLDFEVAPWGPTTVWWGGTRVVEVDGDLGARIGGGIRGVLAAGSEGSRRLVVVTCEGASTTHKGFFWRDRPVGR